MPKIKPPQKKMPRS